jgi:hypothetical protein
VYFLLILLKNSHKWTKEPWFPQGFSMWLTHFIH